LELLDDLERARNLISSADLVRVVSHLDADGLCSAAILVRTLERLQKKFHLSIVTQLTEHTLRELKAEGYKLNIFSDLGSGQIGKISQQPGWRSIIIDHHEFDPVEESDAIVHINAHKYGLDGNKEISGAGMTYLFSKFFSDMNSDMAHIALIGAIGDIQEENGFSGKNKEILQDALNSGKLRLENGIKWFGIETRPLVKLMTYNTELLVPGVSGSEQRAIMFLKSLEIIPQNPDGSWKRYSDLTDEERKRLVGAILMKRVQEEKPDEIIGPRYILVQEEENSPTRDAREYSTMLNSCGRMGLGSIGVGSLLNDQHAKLQAIEALKEYRRRVLESLRWYEENKTSSYVTAGQGYLIVCARNNISPTLIGTVASLISNSEGFKTPTLILTMADNPHEKNIKFSLRSSGKSEYDLRNIAAEMAKQVDGQFGGHKNAAGGYISFENENKFLIEAERILKKQSIEESVV
jgi:RecJ-like exonuclease